MADNFAFTPGSGLTGASDDISGVHYPRFKLIHGADGVNAGDVSDANPFPTKITDGTRTATVRDCGSNDALNVAITDASGSQLVWQLYTEADTDASISGFAMMWEDTSDTLRAVSAAKPLPVNVVSMSATPTVQDNASIVDDAAFTAGTSRMLMVGGTYKSTRDAVDDNDGGAFAMNAKRAIYAALETPNSDSLADDTADALRVIMRDGAGDSCMDDSNNALRVNVVAGASSGTQYAEDAALGSTPTGTLGMMRRDDALGTLTPVEDDAISMRSNSRGALWVVHDGTMTISGTVTANLAAGTNNIGDVDVLTLPALTTGTNSIGKVRLQDGAGNDITSVLLGGTRQSIDVAIRDGSGNHVTSFGGGTQYAEDAAFGGNGTGTLMIARRDDALSTLTPVENDAVGLRVNDSGALWVVHHGNVTVNSHAVTNAGTFAVQVDGAALTSLQLIDDAIYTEAATDSSITGIPILWEDTSDTLRAVSAAKPLPVNIISGASAGTQYAEDAAFGGNGTGTLMIARRDDALSTLTPIEDDAVGLRTNSRGALWVVHDGTMTVSGTVTANLAAGTNNIGDVDVLTLPAVTNAGTFAVQESGSALTALQLIDDAIYTEGATDSSITGVPFLWEDTSNTLRAVSAVKPLPVTLNQDFATYGYGPLVMVASDPSAPVSNVIAIGGNTPNLGSGIDFGAISLDETNLGALLVGGKYLFDEAIDSAKARPVVIGGRGSSATPTAAGTDGDAVYAWYNLNGAQKIVMVDDAGDSAMDGTNNALRVNVVAGAAGGTQYTEADTDSTITGTAILWEDTGDTLRAVSAAKPLPVNIISGAGSGGTAMTDDAAYTVASTSFTPTGGTYKSTRDAVDDNDGGAFAMTAKRALYTTLETPNADSAMDDTADAVKCLLVQSNGSAMTSTDILKVGLVGLSGGIALVDDAAFAVATDRVLPIGGTYKSSRDNLDADDIGAIALTQKRAVLVSLETSTGNNLADLTADAVKVMMRDGAGDSCMDDSNNALRVNVVAGAAGGTQYVEDVAFGGNGTGTLMVARRDDALSTLTPVEDDAVGLRTNSRGALWVVHDGTMTVSGTVTANLAAGTNNIGDVDVLTLPAVTNAGTFAVQESGAALTSLQLIDDVVYTDDTSTHSTGSSKGVGIMAAATPTDTAVNANDIGMIGMSLGREMFTTLRDAAGNNRGANVDATNRLSVSVDNSNVSTNIAQMNGVAVTMGNGASGTGVQRVTIASDSTGTLAVTQATASSLNAQVVGDVAHDGADGGNPVKIGFKAANALPTAVANNDRANGVSDLFGRQLVGHIDPAMQFHINKTFTSSQTGSTLLDPTSGKRIAVTSVVLGSYGTTAGRVIIWFGNNADTTFTQDTDQVLVAASFAPSATNKPGLIYTPSVPIFCTTADRELHITTDAAISLDVTIEGYEY